MRRRGGRRSCRGFPGAAWIYASASSARPERPLPARLHAARHLGPRRELKPARARLSVQRAGRWLDRTDLGIVARTERLAPAGGLDRDDRERQRHGPLPGAPTPRLTRPNARTGRGARARPDARRAWPAARRAPPSRAVPALGRPRRRSRGSPRSPPPRAGRRRVIDQAGELRRLDRRPDRRPASASRSSTVLTVDRPPTPPISPGRRQSAIGRLPASARGGTCRPRRAGANPVFGKDSFDNQRPIENTFSRNG